MVINETLLFVRTKTASNAGRESEIVRRQTKVLPHEAGIENKI